jgi:hypothetical protein
LSISRSLCDHFEAARAADEFFELSPRSGTSSSTWRVDTGGLILLFGDAVESRTVELGQHHASASCSASSADKVGSSRCVHCPSLRISKFLKSASGGHRPLHGGRQSECAQQAVRVGLVIPAHLYVAVAEPLPLVYRLENRGIGA